MNIGPVVSAENRLTNGNCVACSRGSEYFVEYLRIYRTIFAIFSPYESALHADDGALPYFPISQRMLPWQPNHLWTSGITQPKQETLLLQRDRARHLSVEILQLQNISLENPIMWQYLRDSTFSRFDTIPECDRHTHTDRRTDTRRRHIPHLA